MNLGDMKAIVRKDLHDEDETNYRWSNDAIEQHINRAVRELSEANPRQQKATIATTNGSREVDVSGLSGLVTIAAVEYPYGKMPRRFQRFSLWADTLTLLGEETPDGSSAHIYYGKIHTLDATTSTIPARLEDIVASGAEGYAAAEWAVFATNRINIGGAMTPETFLKWGQEKLLFFRAELKRLGRRNRIRPARLYRPAEPVVSQSTDFGP